MITTDPTEPLLKETLPSGQNKAYLVLSEEERAKGYVRPLRDSYVHVGVKCGPVQDLSPEEKDRYKEFGYAAFEPYPPEEKRGLGRYHTAARLKTLKDGMIGGCGVRTKMGHQLAATYARDPKFYGATFCVGCGVHHPVEEFVWDGTSEIVGS